MSLNSVVTENDSPDPFLPEKIAVMTSHPSLARTRRFRVLPGFRLTMAGTLTYLALFLAAPLIACAFKVSELTPQQFWAAVWSPQVQSAYRVTFGTSFLSAVIDTLIGLLLAWVLVRYEFPGKRILDALIDVPFALPTAVAGLVYSSLYVKKGWLGQYLVPLGFQGAYSYTAIVLVLTFIGLPFVVRTLQPVLESFDKDIEEAAACLGASRGQVFWRVLFPGLVPALVTGFALTFARGIGEYGSVVFVSGNMPFKTEIAPVLIVSKLEQFAYPEATAIAVVLLGFSFLMLGTINLLQQRSAHYADR